MLSLLILLALPLIPFASPIPSTSSPFYKVIPYPNKVTIKNSCNYTIYVSPVYGGPYGPSSPSQKIIPANGYSWVSDFMYLPVGGISLKVSKTQDFTTITQFEYTAEAFDKVWYNLSFLNCVKGTEGRDPSACPGWEHGVQAVCGSGDMFRCKANEYCDHSGYFIPENGYKPGAPVKSCKKSEGIMFELCAMV